MAQRRCASKKKKTRLDGAMEVASSCCCFVGPKSQGEGDIKASEAKFREGERTVKDIKRLFRNF